MGEEKGIAILGCGAIGSLLAKAVDEGQVNGKIQLVFDIYPEKAVALANSLRAKPRVASSLEESLNDESVQIVVESASQEAVRQFAEKILRAGKDLLILSSGALLDDNLTKRLLKASRHGGGRIYLPSGAIAGVDAIKALSLLRVDAITLTIWKNPKALSGSPFVESQGIKLNRIRDPICIYEGPAEEAIRGFPANVNVAATLSLSSGSRVRVRIVADPTIDKNIHEITVESPVSRITIKVENSPHPENPKTSYLAALSAIELLRNITGEGLRIGT